MGVSPFRAAPRTCVVTVPAPSAGAILLVLLASSSSSRFGAVVDGFVAQSPSSPSSLWTSAPSSLPSHRRIPNAVASVDPLSSAPRSISGGTRRRNQPARYYAPTKRTPTVLHAVPLSARSSSPTMTSSWWKGKSAKQITSVMIWCLLDLSFRQLFVKFNVSFPSSLAGCGAVLAFLLLLPRTVSNNIVTRRLEPGATLLAQYLPVFFVPSLISLPLADGFGSMAEISKVGVVVAGGFLFTLWTTATSVLAVRKMVRQFQVESNTSDDDDDDLVNESSPTARFIASSDGQIEQDPVQAMSARAVEYAEKNRMRPVVFSRRLQRRLAVLTLLMTLTASVASHFIPLHSTQRSIRTSLCGICLLTSTLLSFVTSSRLPPKITKRIHPLLFTTSFTWAVAAWLAQIGSGSTSFRSVLKYCYRGKASTASAWAAGPLLLYLLGPAVVSLSVSMYRRRQLIQDNVVEVGTATLVSTVGGLLGTAVAVRLLRLVNPFLRLALLSRNITSPLAMAIATILGADTSLAVTMVVITGLLGANFGPSLLDKWGVTDPVARGLSMGAASHGLGTAALAAAGPDEASAFPFAAIGMALCACAATVAVSVPPFRQLILQVALGT